MSKALDYLRDQMDKVLAGKPVRDLPEAFSGVDEEITRLREVLSDAYLQIDYLHGRFQETGSGNAVLARINDVLER